jgi:hypothetical protein
MTITETILERYNIDMFAYHAIHHWLKKNFGKADMCENVECENKSINFSWAKKHNRNYEKERANFLKLCRVCHAKYDTTEDGRRRMTLARTGSKQTAEHVQKRVNHFKKPIVQFDLDGNLIKKWDCIKDASVSLGILNWNISACLQGRTASSGGFKWKYEKLL